MGTNADVQFSVGEQSEAIRKQFWSTNYKQCPICKSENIAVHWWCCGCRFNEDVIYQCLGKENVNDVKNLEWDKTTRNLPGQYGCGFYTSFHYDEGGSEPQQFETDG
ncbi:unnamed protein product [Rotaria sp. Silwood2]|nr:unnamed protein product [Rotaria sp. Silwood2]CAF2891700.1 unnamed protein product [Rotaria sp. Silwood2]CAF3055044.1 unnamed protein product [Rotaria sp. Silwood2]CAF3384588.1 unnamed protein product [Rotaria sp. Silwood2]CAF4066488.1 unnamed protein product [Rotaria sp. Silwood2]